MLGVVSWGVPGLKCWLELMLFLSGQAVGQGIGNVAGNIGDGMAPMGACSVYHEWCIHAYIHSYILCIRTPRTFFFFLFFLLVYIYYISWHASQSKRWATAYKRLERASKMQAVTVVAVAFQSVLMTCWRTLVAAVHATWVTLEALLAGLRTAARAVWISQKTLNLEKSLPVYLVCWVVLMWVTCNMLFLVPRGVILYSSSVCVRVCVVAIFPMYILSSQPTSSTIILGLTICLLVGPSIWSKTATNKRECLPLLIHCNNCDRRL